MMFLNVFFSSSGDFAPSLYTSSNRCCCIVILELVGLPTSFMGTVPDGRVETIFL